MNEHNTGTGSGPWVVISDYPAWPSPYFTEFARHTPHALRLEFTSHLDELTTRSGPPGVINLHRLKRLYTHNGTRTVAAAQAMLIQLSRLRAAGWKLVWTVHNLLPVDAPAPDTTDPHSSRGFDRNSTPDSDSGSGPGWHAVRKADLFAGHGVLALADAVVTHTQADADHLATVTRAPIIVSGWAAPTPTAEAAPGPVTALARRMSMAPFSVLVLGNVAARKDLPTVVDIFARATRHAELFVVGDSRDPQLTTLLQRQAAGEQRVHLHLDRVSPGQVRVLYQATDVALCPYRVDSQWSFLGQAFFPGSVATAAAYGTPVIAPDLPAIREITENLPRRLYPSAEGPALALTAAEAREHRPVPASPPAVHGERQHAGRWRAIGATYVRLARALHTGEPAHPTVCPSSPGLKEPLMLNPSDAASKPSGTTPAQANTDADTGADTDTAGEVIAAVLADHYDLTVRKMVQLPIGQGTVNYRATCDGREVFVKHYSPGADLAAEEQAIGLSDFALRRNIPTAPVVTNRHGQIIDASTSHAVSVWQWMPGRVVTALNTEQSAQAGDALGRIHAVFALLPDSAGPAPEADKWFRRDPVRLAETIDQLLGIIAERTRNGIADSFDLQAEQDLTERRAMLARIPELLTELPPGLTTQVLHGDYSPVNLLFTADTLSAVVDFCPPNPFLVSYDLGRMAFFPHTVTSTPDWLRSAHTLITAYLNANPAVPDADIRACGRVALLQLLGSLYGVKQHYLKPGLFQDDLDAFWLLRHQTVISLLHHLDDTEQVLADIVATRHQ